MSCSTTRWMKLIRTSASQGDSKPQTAHPHLRLLRRSAEAERDRPPAAPPRFLHGLGTAVRCLCENTTSRTVCCKLSENWRRNWRSVGKALALKPVKQCSDLRAVSCTGCIDRILQTEMRLLSAMPGAGLTASQKRCLIARALSLSFFLISSCMCAQHACFLSDSALALGSLG